MKNKSSYKSRAALLFMLCPVRHIILLVSAAVTALHFLMRKNRPLMAFLSEKAVRPVHKALADFNSIFSFSAAEVLICIFLLSLLGFMLVSLFRLRNPWHRGAAVYRLIITPLTAASAVYALFCLMWGTYYYGEDFLSKSGLDDDPISIQELTDTTAYFADMANRYSSLIPRSENGEADFDRERILEKSSELYKNAEALFPCLEAPDVRAKGFHFSRLLSYLDFTGFFFPFTAEANVNTDFPSALFPATVAHELSHQRGVAREQEANFAAVLSCLEYGDAEYVYSAALLAYTYLGNALKSADAAAWEEIYLSLDENIVTDLKSSNSYWAQFETPVQEISDSVYESFLYSYDQTLGLKSYGACVDLLVNYYS